jgi:hypothetical protein
LFWCLSVISPFEFTGPVSSLLQTGHQNRLFRSNVSHYQNEPFRVMIDPNNIFPIWRTQAFEKTNKTGTFGNTEKRRVPKIKRSDVRAYARQKLGKIYCEHRGLWMLLTSGAKGKNDVSNLIAQQSCFSLVFKSLRGALLPFFESFLVQDFLGGITCCDR